MTITVQIIPRSLINWRYQKNGLIPCEEACRYDITVCLIFFMFDLHLLFVNV